MIKKLLKNLGKYKKDSLITPIFIALEVAIDIAIPILMARLIDSGIDKGDINVIWKIGGFLILLTFISLFFGIFAGKYAARASSGFAKNLRENMFTNIQTFSFSNIDKFSTASIITRLTVDVSYVEQAFQTIIRIVARSPLMLIFALIMTYKINPNLSIIYFTMVPFLGIGLILIILKVHPIFERIFKTYDKLNNVVQENLSGIRVVKSYVREDFEKEKFNSISKEIYTDFTIAEKILALNGPLVQFSMYACILLLSWFGAKFVVSETMTTGELMSLFTYTIQILMSLIMLSMVFVMIVISRASAERIIEVLDEETDIKNNDNPIFNVPNGNVAFENVNFSYVDLLDKCSLKNITFSVKSGETIGVIGGTGSSKTTLVQLIPRLYDVTSGKVFVGGINVLDYDLDTLRNEVAMVLQKNELFSGTIKENLRWGNENATDEELIHICKLAQAHDFIMSFHDGYDTYIEQGGTNVSGGQKQRLTIARALLKKPKILILDDSTSAVDTKTDSLIRKAFREEIPNTTKFIIAQRISSIEDADKIIVLEDGMINGIGTHDELMENNSIYKEVYNSQQKGGGGLE